MWSPNNPLSGPPPIEHLADWLAARDCGTSSGFDPYHAVRRYITDARPIEWYWQDVADFIDLTGPINEYQQAILKVMCAAGGIQISVGISSEVKRLRERLKYVK